MSSQASPYSNLPAFHFWKSGVVDLAPGQFDPIVRTKFKISQEDTIVTLGSCFAQHLSRFVRENGFNYLSLEMKPKNHVNVEPVDALTQNFSALYGNVYTAKQALQLVQRSQGWEPSESVWSKDGRYYDPYRPTVFSNGFPDPETVFDERSSHLSIVAQLFQTCDIVVFTLGLTEAWVSKTDGAVFPVAPGVVAGSFCEDLHSFVNFSYREVLADISDFCLTLKRINPRIKIILTVSPVSLNATFEKQNVLVSSTYSKSVLRAAAGEIVSTFDFVDYFPSFEIINNPQNHCRYLEDDLRNVTALGVKKVMALFQKHYMSSFNPKQDVDQIHTNIGYDATSSEQIAQIICDEDLINNETT
jgi:hypothetical protein